ncbi:hypothetical protein [Streptomyces luteogriseus]|uniref:hypothetical protein n=1 Tax=Streptomyces luteogriseus TaxID=68233 RepID=UPI00381E13B4
MTTTRNETGNSSGFGPVLTRGAHRVLVGEEITGPEAGEADPQEIKDSSERLDHHCVDSPVRRQSLAARP